MGFNGVFSANGEAWRRQTDGDGELRSPAHQDLFPGARQVTERFEKRWRRAAAAGETIDLQADLMRYTVDVTSGSLRVDINTLESDDEVIQAHLDQIFPALFQRLMAPFPYWTWLKQELDGHLKALHEAVAGFIAQARQRMAGESRLREAPTNLIEAMIAARDNPDSGLTDADVAGNVLTMLLAGEDTTANTLAWMIYLLHRIPTRCRAREEVLKDASLRHDGAAVPSMRASTRPCAQAGGADHHPAAHARHDGRRHRGSEGTLLMCLMRAAATDERRFPTRALRSRRWLSGASAASPKRVSMPFGAGPRLCRALSRDSRDEDGDGDAAQQLRDRERRHARRRRGARAPGVHNVPRGPAPQAKSEGEGELAALDARDDLGQLLVARRGHADLGALARDVAVHRVDLGAPAFEDVLRHRGTLDVARGFEPAFGTISASTSASALASPSFARAICSGSAPRIFSSW